MKYESMVNKKRDELVFLEDTIHSIEKIEEYVKNISEQDFKINTEKQDTVIRRIEIIGEALKNISTKTREKHSNIPWRDIAGMRDMVIHQYFGVSIGMVWKVATSEIPDLKIKLQEILYKLDPD